jgi:microtubule-associated protein-like 6
MINLTKTNIDANGNEMKTDENGELVDSVKGRSIGVSPDGIYVVVGFKEGTIRVNKYFITVFKLFDKELK